MFLGMNDAAKVSRFRFREAVVLSVRNAHVSGFSLPVEDGGDDAHAEQQLVGAGAALLNPVNSDARRGDAAFLPG